MPYPWAGRINMFVISYLRGLKAWGLQQLSWGRSLKTWVRSLGALYFVKAGKGLPEAGSRLPEAGSGLSGVLAEIWTEKFQICRFSPCSTEYLPLWGWSPKTEKIICKLTWRLITYFASFSLYCILPSIDDVQLLLSHFFKETTLWWFHQE